MPKLIKSPPKGEEGPEDQLSPKPLEPIIERLIKEEEKENKPKTLIENKKGRRKKLRISRGRKKPTYDDVGGEDG